MASKKGLAAAFDRIKRWMMEHGAPLLVENLAAGATSRKLDKAGAALGFPLPSDLRDLWALHDGQKDEQNGFVEHFDLFGTGRALGERETVLLFVELLRETPDAWEEPA